MPKLGRPPQTREQKFWKRVDKNGPNGCWLWTSVHGGLDYGMLSSNSQHKAILAHRLSWEIHYGAIPDGMYVLHKCDVPKCVNPDHLFLGTYQDNSDDCVRKDRQLKGEQINTSKLTKAQVLAIRSEYSSGKVSQQKLADLYGVHQTTVGFIIRRVTWDHV